jgi:hypothetical protein
MRYAAAIALASVLKMQLDTHSMILATAHVAKDSTAAALTTEAALGPHPPLQASSGKRPRVLPCKLKFPSQLLPLPAAIAQPWLQSIQTADGTQR